MTDDRLQISAPAFPWRLMLFTNKLVEVRGLPGLKSGPHRRAQDRLSTSLCGSRPRNAPSFLQMCPISNEFQENVIRKSLIINVLTRKKRIKRVWTPEGEASAWAHYWVAEAVGKRPDALFGSMNALATFEDLSLRKEANRH